MFKSLFNRYLQPRKQCIVFFLTFLFLFLLSMPANAIFNDFKKSNDGKFEILDCPYEFKPPAIKLQDGNVIFPPDILFDAKNNKFIKLKNKEFYPGIVLNNGDIFLRKQ